MRKPLFVDLFCGLGGFTEGALLEGYDCVGFDIERHEYGDHRYPGQLVIQDVLTLHGSQFKNATLIVASPPCQEYSYMAMPWSKAKAIAADYRSGARDVKKLTALFDACFRLQREACEAAGHHIPLIVENVRGAQPWVGRARWMYGSFALWGDVPALMPITFKGFKSSGMNWSDPAKRGQDFTRLAGREAIKNNGGSWFAIAHNTTSGKGQNPDGRKNVGPAWDAAKGCGAHGMKRWTNPGEGTKQGGDWFAEARKGGVGGTSASFGSKSSARKMASAMIARIPLPLSRHIAATFRGQP